MKRNLKITFANETDWATSLEAIRKLGLSSPPPGDNAAEKNGALIAMLCRAYLDNPKPPNGEEKP